jgi:hypothetical protein
MNYSTAVFLINDSCRGIEGIYEPDTEHKKQPRRTFKTFDKSVKVGDLIIVPSGTRHKFTTFKVTKVDVEVDPATNEKIDWVVGVVDGSTYDRLVADENEAIARIKAAEKTYQREELKKKMFAHMSDAERSALSISSAPAIAPPSGAKPPTPTPTSVEDDDDIKF